MKAIFEEFKMYFVVGFVLVLLGAALYIHHNGYTEGVATADLRVKQANDDRDAANAQATELASLFRNINNAAAKAQAEAKAQKARADKALEDLSIFKTKHSTAEEKWNKKLSNSASKSNCAILKELICPSVMDY